jgi:hypothetical protein
MIRFKLFWALLIAVPATAQDTTKSKPVVPFPDRYLTIYWEPLSVIDLAGSSIRLGAEYAWNRRWAAYTTVGDYVWEGYVVRSGLQYTVAEGTGDKAWFGLEAMHQWHTRVFKDYYENAAGDGPDKSKPSVTYGILKENTMFSVLFGTESTFWKVLTIRGYFGVGVKFRRGVAFIRQSLQDSLTEAHEGQPFDINYDSGTNVWPNILAGFTVGYLLPLRKARRK